MIRIRASRRPGFTLAELLVAVAIIVILASTVLLAMYGAMENARESRTRSQIAHIHEQLSYRWQSYRSRSVPLRLSSSFVSLDDSNNPVRQRMTARIAAQLRLAALRDLQRMELPDRRLDVFDGPSLLYYENDPRRWYPAAAPGAQPRWLPYPNPTGPTILAQPALHRTYQEFVNLRTGGNPAAWSETFQGAECLYMILANMQEGGTTALDFFKAAEIGDVDRDGMPEILDAWGHPIEFIRWPAGFSAHPGPDLAWGVAGVDDDQDGQVDNGSEAAWLGSDDIASPSDLHDRSTSVGDPGKSGDPLDPFKVDYRWWTVDGNNNPYFVDDPFALFPLVYSAGRDGIYDILSDTNEPIFATPAPLRYTATQRPWGMGQVPYPNDPYVAIDSQFEIGRTSGALLLLYGADLPSHDWPVGTKTVPADGVDGSIDNIHNHYIEAR